MPNLILQQQILIIRYIEQELFKRAVAERLLKMARNTFSEKKGGCPRISIVEQDNALVQVLGEQPFNLKVAI